MSAARAPRRVVVVGDVVLDRDVTGEVRRVAPDAPVPVLDATAVRESPGGAGLTAVLAALDPDVRVLLAAPVAADDAGRRLRELLAAAGVDLLALPHEGATRRKSRMRAAGQSLLRVDDGGPGTPGPLAPELLGELAGALERADAVLVSDYGAGTTRAAEVRDLLAAAARRRPVVWDPHPRGGSPVPGCAVVTPNLAEARGAAGGDGEADVVAAALRERWAARSVCVTAGARGAFLAADGSEPLYLPAPAVEATDPCGAGDRFAATVAGSLAAGRLVSESVADAVADASAWVAAGGSGGFWARTGAGGADGALRTDDGATTGDDDGLPGASPAQESLAQLAARLRRGGRTLVATGGCFDVLHAGHVACLAAARRLGDALVVLINSDESVRRLKGPTRPAVGQEDRARVLAALASVDAVAVFPEDDPRRALAELRPDVWAKGGDYGGAELPEAPLVRSWGGRVVLLPYLDGRSTTRILGDRSAAGAAGRA